MKILSIAIFFSVLAASTAEARKYTVEILSPEICKSAARYINNQGMIQGDLNYIPRRWINGVLSPVVFENGNTADIYGINEAGYAFGTAYTNRLPSIGAVWDPNGAVTYVGYGETVYGANDVGQIVGMKERGRPARRPYPMLWANKKPIQLPGSEDTGEGVARDINNDGVIAGYTAGYIGTVRFYEAVKWINGMVQRIPLPPNAESQATDINEKGNILGYYRDADQRGKGFLATDSGVQLLPDLGYGAYPLGLNSQDDIVGYAVGADRYTSHAVLWSQGKLIDLRKTVDPALASSGWELRLATSINDRGQIVGRAVNVTIQCESGFLMTPLD